MTINLTKERFNTQAIDHMIGNEDDAAGDGKRRLKNEILADETCRLLFGDSTNLLDDIFTHPLSVDYLNVYLSLPIFGQRVLYQRTAHQFGFDPPLLLKNQNQEQAKEWLIHCRLNDYIHTDIYIESLLALLLTRTDETLESSTQSYTFMGSKETITEEPSYVFSTVTDVRQFHQFLQSTSGIKYWNFFIDSMRLLRSRRSSQAIRIDISSLNFIYKYNSQQDELRSITMNLDKHSMPHSSTPDTIWFRMAINALHQLRIYWLPRYLSEVSLPSRSKRKHPTLDPIPHQSSENSIENPFNEPPKTSSTVEEVNFVKHTIGNISYIDYNPQQYIFIQSSDGDDFPPDGDQFNQSDDTNQTEKEDSQIEFEDALLPRSDRSVEDYATDDNLELFYRIVVSDLLAGSPFSQYISQTMPQTDAKADQTCIRFITDAEVLLSISVGKFQERIVQQFISRYLHVTATEELPIQINDLIEEQRTDLIEELTTNDDNQYPLLWELLLKITKFLIHHFLDYIKFDRLRFLVQIKSNTSNPTLILKDLSRLLPSVNFDTFLTDQLENKTNEKERVSRSNLIHCGGEQNDLLHGSIEKQFNTTEKLINTDARCTFRPGERFPPLNDIELEEELRRFCTKFQWKDIQTILGKSFDVSIPSHHTAFIGNPSLPPKVTQSSISNEDLKLNSIETFTLDIMHSARGIVEIDHFITNLMDESLNLFQTNSSFDSAKSDLNSSPLSPKFEEILFTDSSLSKPIIDNTNNNAVDFPHSENDNPIILLSTKFLSSIGSYFINSPNLTLTMGNLPIQSSEFAYKSTSNLFDTGPNQFPSTTINTPQTNFFHESIKFAPKDASNEVKNLLINQRITSILNENQQQLLAFIHKQITNDQWPLEEYIGYKGQRAWRGLKLAADMSDLDSQLMLNYHNDFDWISSDENLGSFGERNFIIQRTFSRHVEQQQARMR